MGVQLISTNLYGPLPKGYWGLLMGRSSSAVRGLVIHPGVIDNDYTGEIKIMAESPKGIISIEKQQRIAQLVLLPLVKNNHCNTNELRGNRGFGSTGQPEIRWVTPVKDRPMLTLKLNTKSFTGLIDTGADVTIIAHEQWPKDWPLKPHNTEVIGIGGKQNVFKSSMWLHWEDKDGTRGWIQPCVIKDLDITLWGRDILHKMGAVIMTPSQQTQLN